MKEIDRISLKSGIWQKEDRHYVTQRLLDRGFSYADELMELRIFDLLNIYRINAEVGREIILMLYRICNPNDAVDEGMELMLIDQYFPFTAWRKKHRDLSKLTVRELVMTEDINHRAIMHFYNSVLKAFFKSEEYNSREYRYYSYDDMLEKQGQYNEPGR